MWWKTWRTRKISRKVKLLKSTTQKRSKKEKAFYKIAILYLLCQAGISYEALSKYFINYIKQNYEHGVDIATAIISQELINTSIWMPKLKIIKEKILFWGKTNWNNSRSCLNWTITNTTKDKKTYEINLTKGYDLFWGRCSKKMKEIKAKPDFKYLIANNLFELLKAIKEHLTSYQENRYNI
jgi:hypothetical protein